MRVIIRANSKPLKNIKLPLQFNDDSLGIGKRLVRVRHRVPQKDIAILGVGLCRLPIRQGEPNLAGLDDVDGDGRVGGA